MSLPVESVSLVTLVPLRRRFSGRAKSGVHAKCHEDRPKMEFHVQSVSA